MSETAITFLDTKVYKGVRFNEEYILDMQSHYKQQNLPVHELLLMPLTRQKERFR